MRSWTETWFERVAPLTRGGARLLILAYHQIAERGLPGRVTPARFRTHLEFLTRTCHLVSLADGVASLRAASRADRVRVAITFDDGYGDTFSEAFPLLLAYRVPATVFVATGLIDGHFKGQPMLTTTHIREMAAHGIAFGAHTVTHPILSMLSAGAAAQEIAASKARIEQLTGQAATAFAYPNGRSQDFTHANVIAVRNCGFRSAVTTMHGANTPAQSPFLLRRIGLGDWTPAQLALRMSGLADLPIVGKQTVQGLVGRRRRGLHQAVSRHSSPPSSGGADKCGADPATAPPGTASTNQPGTMSAATTAGHRYRVLLLTQDLKLAGAQRQLVELARGLARSGHDVRVGIFEPGGPLTSDLTESAIPLVSFPRRWRWDPWPVAQLAAYLRREHIDLVHAFLFLPSFYGRVAGRLAGIGMISSLRGIGIEGRYRYRIDVATCGLCDVLIANSAAGRADYVAHGGPPDRIVVIPNGMDATRLQAASSPTAERARWRLDRFDHVIGMVGTMESLRDHRLLVHAMQHIVREQPRTGLLLAGDGSLREDIATLVRRLELTEHVIVAGTVRRAETVYPLLDVYVQASATEGISNSILEAMLCAKPVVATAVGGNPEVVLHERTGYLVPPGDERAMAAAVVRLLDDGALRRRLGANGRCYAQDAFSLERMITATEDLYDVLLDAKRHGGHAGRAVRPLPVAALHSVEPARGLDT